MIEKGISLSNFKKIITIKVHRKKISFVTEAPKQITFSTDENTSYVIN